MNSILNLPTFRSGFPAPELTFDTLIVCDSNREAVSAAKSVLLGSGSLLILCGCSGVGKTHLLHAIHAELLTQNPAAVIRHLNADEFTGYLIYSIRNGIPEQFRAECETADAFLLDDVQYLSGKQHTQEELFRFLEARRQAGLPTVMTLDGTFEDAQSIEHSLRSLFPGMAFAAIAALGHEIRAGVVRAKAAELELQLSEEEIELIAQQAPGNLRNIHGILSRISLYHSFPEAFPDTPSISEIVRSASLN